MFIPFIFPVLLSLWVISKSYWLGVGRVPARMVVNQLERYSQFFNCWNHNFPGMNDVSIQATFGDGYLFYKLRLGVKKYDIYYSLFQVFQKG
jgi:hypothetical protein